MANLRAPRVTRHTILGERDEIEIVDAELFEHRARHAELPLAAVDDEQIRECLFLDRAGIAPLQHLVEAREVVLSRNALHPVASVAILVRFALVEDHHRANDLPSLEIGDVEALDALWCAAQVEALLQLRDHARALVLAVTAGGEALARVLHGHLAEPDLVAALRTKHLDALLLQVGKVARANLGVV